MNITEQAIIDKRKKQKDLYKSFKTVHDMMAGLVIGPSWDETNEIFAKLRDLEKRVAALEKDTAP